MNCALKVIKNKDGTIFTSSWINMREVGEKFTAMEQKRGKWPENTETYKPHATALCIVLLDHTSYCTKNTIIINHWCLPSKKSKTTTTQMKDSMRTRLGNLSDQRGHAIWQKGTVLISLFFLATWKDILHLAHISRILCILESKSIANITKKKKIKTKQNTAMKMYKVTYTDSMCVWNILYMCYITAFFFVFVQ